jgi:hypothetical protein
MEPGRGSGPFTGHRVSFNPDRIADTSARLSRLFRPGTDGTVIGGGLVVSFTMVDESTAITATGSSVGPIASGGEAGCDSLIAQATASAWNPINVERQNNFCILRKNSDL